MRVTQSDSTFSSVFYAAAPNLLPFLPLRPFGDRLALAALAFSSASLIAANLLEQEGYTALNVSDGFSGNGQDPGWKNSGLPTK